MAYKFDETNPFEETHAFEETRDFEVTKLEDDWQLNEVPENTLDLQEDGWAQEQQSLKDNEALAENLTDGKPLSEAEAQARLELVEEDFELLEREPVGLAEAEDSEAEATYLEEASEGMAEYSDAINELPEWLGEINPNFDPYDVNSPYCNNCGSCAYAVYRRLEGDPDICATATNIPYNDEMTALTGMEQVPMSPGEIEARLLQQGNGAHAIIGIDRAEGPGHWFNAACIDGKVYAIDGQTGEITDWPPDYGNVVNWEMSVKKGEY